jgi:acetolactate synthase I/II/III large subunit
MNLYGGGLVARTLKHFGVGHLFALPGHQILSVFDACPSEGLDLISTRHEASVVYMAQALSIARREPGVVLLAGGPELTNALTGIAHAYYAKTPLVVISGSNTPAKRDKGYPQDMDQFQVVRPFTKWARGCQDVHRIPEYLEIAYRQAMRGRPGPVYLEIPYDVMETRVSGGEVALPETPGLIRPGADQDAVQALAGFLKRARRPVAVAGSGALWSGAAEELSRFAQKTGIPLILSSAAMAMPFHADEVTGLGGLGVSRPSIEAITRADLILLLGTRLNFSLGFGQPPFITAGQKIVQIDIEPEEIGANRRVDLGIAADLRTSLRDFNALEVTLPSYDAWRAGLQKSADKYRAELCRIAEAPRQPLHPLRLVLDLESARTDDSYLVLDGANSILWALMTAQARPQGGIVLSTLGELQAIGAGVPHALALKRAYPERQVILHTGDGSFGYGLMEMETAVRYGIPLVVVVHNDSGWGMTRDMQVEFFGARGESGHQLGVVRYERMVEALGGHGEFVERAEQLQPALERALSSGKPACVNVLVDAKPKSPGLMTFMLMEVMLGKQTYYDRIPQWMRRLRTIGLDGLASKAMLRYLDRNLHKEME